MTPVSVLWRGSDQAARDEVRRRRLLDAALELYGTAGYRGTTVQSVCRLASVSSRSFYELYSNQEQLLAQLYGELNAEILGGLRSVVVTEEPSLATVVYSMVSAALEPMLLDERKARVLEVEAVGVSHDLELARRDAYRTFAQSIDAAFAALVAAGKVTEAPGGLASLILVGGITEALVQRVQTPPGDRSPTARFLSQISEVVLRLLR